MTTLLLKDLRLSLDVLRPWGLLVAGFAVGMWLLASLPSTLVPVDLRGMSLAEMLIALAALIAATSMAVGAWLATVIVRGDQSHGAGALAAILPTSPSRRVGSKVIALAAATAMLPLAAAAALVVALTLRPTATAESLGRLLLLPAAALAGAFIGAGAASFIATLVRGTFAIVAISLLGILLAGISGSASAATGLQLLCRDVVDAGARPGAITEYLLLRSSVLTGGAIASIATTGLAAGIVGMTAMARPRGARWIAMSGAALLLVALITGLASSKAIVANDPQLANWSAYNERLAEKLSLQELAAFVRSMTRDGGIKDPIGSWNQTQAIVARIVDHRRHLPSALLETDPVELAFRSVEDFSQPIRARFWLRTMALEDPRWFPTMLDSLTACTNPELIYEACVGMAERQGLWQAGSVPGYPYPMTPQERMRFEVQRRDVLVAELERLIREGHPERERMQRAVDALRRAAARLDPPSAPEPTP